MMEFVENIIDSIHWETVIFTIIKIVLILVAAWIATRIIGAALNRLEKRWIQRDQAQDAVPGEAEKRAETLSHLLNKAIAILLWLIAGLMVLREAGVEIGPILASAGIVGLAVGFGAQNLVRDVISGFFILLENQVRVGDVAIINGTGGLVEAVNFRTLVLRDLSGVVHIFPNGSINTLSNMTREWSAYVFDIGVAYKEDVDKVMHIMEEVGREMREDPDFGPFIIEDIEIFGVDQFADSAVTIKGRLKTKPIKQWETGREFRRRLKHAFDKAGIEIPFPHRSIYFGEASKPILAELMDRDTGPN